MTMNSWSELVAEVRDAMDGALSTDSEPAHALAWRWVGLASGTTRAVEETEGITPSMASWIGEAFAHARCVLFARHLDAAQVEHLRHRLIAALPRAGERSALVDEVRRQMDAGADPASAPVQALVRRLHQHFRDSHGGSDAALEARVLEAILREPELRLDVGVDDALLAFLQRAHLVGHDVPRENAGPKPSALMVAMQRAAHQLVDRPLVLDDPMALAILAPGEQQALRADLDPYRTPMAQGMRSSLVVRSRFAEDEWMRAIERGVRQYVILGAGLDTGAYRHVDAPGRIFEVDLPATQAWKQARLAEAGIAVPTSLAFVPVDFETVSLADGLARAGFDAGAPAFFSWLGVTMYLDEAAVVDTLRFIAGCAPGSAVALEYVVPLAGLPTMMRVAMEQLAVQLAERGEPWKSFFEPQVLAEKVAALGFASSRTMTPEELNQRYLAGRSDGLRIIAAPSRLMLAEV